MEHNQTCGCWRSLFVFKILDSHAHEGAFGQPLFQAFTRIRSGWCQRSRTTAESWQVASWLSHIGFAQDTLLREVKTTRVPHAAPQASFFDPVLLRGTVGVSAISMLRKRYSCMTATDFKATRSFAVKLEVHGGNMSGNIRGIINLSGLTCIKKYRARLWFLPIFKATRLRMMMTRFPPWSVAARPPAWSGSAAGLSSKMVRAWNSWV